jgi:DNA polymerase (family 10)
LSPQDWVLANVMAKLDASEIARLLVEFGQRSALRGGNPYRARAYRKAAESLMALSVPLGSMVAQDRLREIPGVGGAIADIIRKLHATGTHPALDAMRQEVPEGVLEMLSIPGLKPEKALKIHKDLGVSSLDALEQAVREDRLSKVKGLGAALQRKIMEGLEIRRRAHGRRHIHRAAELLTAAERNLRQSHLGLKRIAAAGDFRRGCELIGDLSLVAQAATLEGAPEIPQPTEQFRIYLTDEQRYGVTLLRATGAEPHLQQLKAAAEAKGLVLDENGVRRDTEVVACRTEEEIYAALGLPFIEPELREGRNEIELARANRLPALVRDGDIRGILHAHTNASDGVHTLEQMAEATRKRGYSYFGVADHSRSAGYAGGLSIDEIEEQHAAADRLNASYRREFRIFKGIESDILPDGSLDYPDEILARFDFVVASVHSRFRLDQKTQTERIIRAVSNPYTTILGHMTGRQLLRRPGYDIDIEKVLTACAKHCVAVEINANPWRLDLDWRWHARALELGCVVSINPDAHSTSELGLTHWGVEMARKGGVPKERVLNCLNLEAMRKFLADRNGSHGRQYPRTSSDRARASTSLSPTNLKSSGRRPKSGQGHPVRARGKRRQAAGR